MSEDDARVEMPHFTHENVTWTVAPGVCSLVIVEKPVVLPCIFFDLFDLLL